MANQASAGCIRVMRADERERVHEIYALAHVDEYAGESVDFTPQGIVDSPDLLKMFELSQILVYDDGEIKGFGGTFNERIVWLYVHPAHRGQQIGQQLIDYMLTALGEQTIGISVIKSNQVALNLYIQRGFRVIGDFSFDYQGVPVAVYRLQRLLPAASSTTT